VCQHRAHLSGRERRWAITTVTGVGEPIILVNPLLAVEVRSFTRSYYDNQFVFTRPQADTKRVADLKRRNSHLGHVVGDADIAEFEGLIATTAQADGTAHRVSGDRWLMLSRSNANDRIQAVLDHYQLAQQFVSGWRIRVAGPARSGSPRRGLRL
jgi:hypothetical protein